MQTLFDAEESAVQGAAPQVGPTPTVRELLEQKSDTSCQNLPVDSAQVIK